MQALRDQLEPILRLLDLRAYRVRPDQKALRGQLDRKAHRETPEQLDRKDQPEQTPQWQDLRDLREM